MSNPPQSRSVPSKAELERRIYTCQRNAQEWRDMGGPTNAEEAAQWEEQAAFLALFAASEKPSINPAGLVKMIRDQRDEIWNAALALLSHCDAKPEGETDFERAVIDLRAACAKVPSYSQRLDNIFKGIADVE